MIKATLRLFNAVQVDSKEVKEIPKNILERTIRNGYLLAPSIPLEDDLLSSIESVVGISGDKANSAFHKSWSIIQDSPIELLALQQMVHYITTYGFKLQGIYREDTVYIPHEVLELPDIEDDIPLVLIKAMSADEILQKIIALSSAGIALAQETLDDIMSIIKTNRYDKEFVDRVENRELKTLLYNHYEIVPSEPTEFFRYLITKLSGKSLIIKNSYLIEKIKSSDGKLLDSLLKDAPSSLPSIFFRYKPLFLAMKSISNNKTFFNRLRKRADRLHSPLPEDYLKSITSQIKQRRFNIDLFAKKIKKATIFRKIRVAYALNYRLTSQKSILYRVRNGRGWATSFDWHQSLIEDTKEALDLLLASIAEDIRENVSDKVFYIPKNVHYALPSTEKQFTGHLPTGSWVSVPEDLIVGIHWTNVKNRSVDLDLSMVGVSGKVGWDADYKSQDGKILFSGDIVDAPPPNGASELFYIQKGIYEPQILIVNHYNYHYYHYFQTDDSIDCKIVVAEERPKIFNKNYMIDVNNILVTANIKISKKQNILGLIVNIDGENRVYFANIALGNSLTSSINKSSMYAKDYLVGKSINSIDFEEILTMAGATVVNQIPSDGDFFDLSPEMVDRESFIDIIKPKKSTEES